MEVESQLNKLKRCLSNLPNYKALKKSSFVSNDSVTTSSELQKVPKREKVNNLNKSIEEQINKAKMLICHAKQKVGNDKTLTQNFETSPITFQSIKQRNRIHQITSFLKKPNAPRSNSHENFPTQFSTLLTPQCTKIRSNQSPKKCSSPKKKTAQSLQDPFTKNNLDLQNLNQARDIDSFVLDEGQQLQVSIVQEHGDKVLNWAICQGKATEFKILKFVDEGKFGKVYLAQQKYSNLRSHRNGVIYSIKSIYRSTLDADTMQQLIRQVKIQSFIDHPSIVKIYHFFVDEDSAYLVLEPCLGGNLYNYLKKHEKVAQKLVRQWIKQVCLAVQYMHKNDIIHRDLKPQNILLHENMIKICDFGWAVHSPLLRGTLCGTPLYTSPEIVSKKPYDSKTDIWSIGVLTYELLYGNIPFEIRHLDDMAKIVEQQVYFSQETNVSEAAKDFMSKCMSKNPIDRPTIRQLLEHEFLNKIDKYRWTIM